MAGISVNTSKSHSETNYSSQFNRLRIPTERKQTIWLFKRITEKLNDRHRLEWIQLVTTERDLNSETPMISIPAPKPRCFLVIYSLAHPTFKHRHLGGKKEVILLSYRSNSLVRQHYEQHWRKWPIFLNWVILIPDSRVLTRKHKLNLVFLSQDGI